MSEQTWTVAIDQTNTLGPMFFFVLSQFEKLFGQEIMRAEKCFVYNDPAADFPITIFNSTPIKIRTSVETLAYKNQLVYHLSHELMHYAFRQKRAKKDEYLSWFEELVCEAISLYILKYSGAYWKACKLSRQDQFYGRYMTSYLREVLDEQATDRFSTCTSIDRLAEYEKVAETDRAAHISERNALYNEFLKDPSQIKHLLNYADYRTGPGRLLIDFDQWHADCPSVLIRFVGQMQPCNPNDYSN